MHQLCLPLCGVLLQLPIFAALIGCGMLLAIPTEVAFLLAVVALHLADVLSSLPLSLQVSIPWWVQGVLLVLSNHFIEVGNTSMDAICQSVHGIGVR